MALVLKTTKFVEAQIDTFLDIVSDSALIFRFAVDDYLQERTSQFEERLNLIRENEKKVDDLRIAVE
ncbi:MAG: DUF47 domain-containing protein, partial [Candidatus Cloacimonetes bacterium]|nr:DUF47 domain-containing protein [Candidatus Cloacimonadota bacterium]